MSAFLFSAENLIKDGGFERGAIISENDQPERWAAYLIKDSGGAFDVVAGGRSGKCARYSKQRSGSHNLHLNQVFTVTPNKYYEVRAWVKGDTALRPVLAVSGMNWGALRTVTVEPTADWKEWRLFFYSGDATLYRLEWFGGASGKLYTGVEGTTYLDDVSIVEVDGSVIELGVTVRPLLVVREGIPPRPIGISENLFQSSDRYFTNRKFSQVETLRMLGGSTIRGMEGNIGDFLIWAEPPYQKPALRLTAYHPNRGYMSSWYNPDHTLQMPLEFDEYLSMALSAGVKDIFYIIGIDAMRADPSQWDYVLPNAKAEIIAAAEAQARYARAHGVHCWFEVGNENDLKETDTKKKVTPWTPGEYSEMARLVAQAVKRGDPQAKIGINGGFLDNKEWFDLILPAVADCVDFLVVHVYHPEGVRVIERANEAIDKWFSPEKREAMPICITETSSFAASAKDSRMRNNMAESLKNLTRMFLNLSQRRVAFMHFWTDRSDAKTPDWAGTCGFAPDGGLLPVAKVLAVLNEHLGDRLVKVDSEVAGVRVFATRSGEKGGLRVFIIGAIGAPLRASVRVDGVSFSGTADVWQWKGTSGEDTSPVWERARKALPVGGAYVVDVPAYGFAMLSLN